MRIRIGFADDWAVQVSIPAGTKDVEQWVKQEYPAATSLTRLKIYPAIEAKPAFRIDDIFEE